MTTNRGIMKFRPTRNQWILLARSTAFFAVVLYIQYACWLTSPSELGRFPLNAISGATSLLEWAFLPGVFYFTFGAICGEVGDMVSKKLRLKRSSWLVTLAAMAFVYFVGASLLWHAMNALWNWTNYGWLVVTAIQVVVAQPMIHFLRPIWRSGPRALLRGTVRLLRWFAFTMPRDIRSLFRRGRHGSSQTRQPWVTSFEARPVAPSHRSRQRRRRYAYNASHNHRPYGTPVHLPIESYVKAADEFFASTQANQ